MVVIMNIQKATAFQNLKGEYKVKILLKAAFIFICLSSMIFTAACTSNEVEKHFPTIKEERAEEMAVMLEKLDKMNAGYEKAIEEKGEYCSLCDGIPGYTGANINLGDSHMKKCTRCGYVYSEPAPHNYMRIQDDMEIFIGYPFEGYYYYMLKYGDYRQYYRMCEDCRAFEIAISREPMYILTGKVK